ncbi:MAG: 5-guanidino-2-oxopentanoate decarboxylase [Pseudomonadales bacterium]
MNARERGTTVSDALLELLARRGVDTVFGVPGNHTVTLYRHLERHGIRHVTCRHEQGAAFMADGYARASGRPGVCVLIGGPGLLNAATGIAQARADSVPMLVLTAVGAVADLGMGRGTLHELPDQHAAAAAFCRTSHTLLAAANLENLIERAFAGFASGRPGPAHLQIPLDLMEAERPGLATRGSVLSPPGADPAITAMAAERLIRARAPLILVGGGAAHAGSEITALAERLDCPVLNTVNGKGICPASHPLAAGGSPSLPSLRRAMAEADVLLAVGTELGETDYDLLMTGPLAPHPGLIRLDIDAEQLLIPFPPAIGITTDAATGVRALCAMLPDSLSRNGAERAAALRRDVRAEPHYHPEIAGFFAALEAGAPGAVIVGDSTRPTYYAAWQLERERPRSYFHSVSGFGTLGYALPAAVGAALAQEAPVIALIGDGGLQFTLPELGTAAALGLPLAVVVWQNQGYREIENSMRARNVPAEATHIRSADLEAAARAHHALYARAASPEALTTLLRTAFGHERPTLIEVSEADLLTRPSGGWYG